jgi:hypothetical protein
VLGLGGDALAIARRGGWQRAVLFTWVGAYAVSWALTLYTAS